MHSKVTINGEVRGQIGKGFMVLIGVGEEDTVEIADKMIHKMVNMRIFEDENGKTILNEDGSINSVSADHNNVNKLKSSLALDVQNRIDNIESVDIRIPAGLLFSDSALTGAGIKLRLKVFAISSAVIEFKDEFSSAGINQTKYSLSANIRIPVKIAGIGSSVDSEIVTAVPIAETIIVGNIPHAYLDTSNK